MHFSLTIRLPHGWSTVCRWKIKSLDRTTILNGHSIKCTCCLFSSRKRPQIPACGHLRQIDVRAQVDWCALKKKLPETHLFAPPSLIRAEYRPPLFLRTPVYFVWLSPSLFGISTCICVNNSGLGVFMAAGIGIAGGAEVTIAPVPLATAAARLCCMCCDNMRSAVGTAALGWPCCNPGACCGTPAAGT